MLEAVFLPCPSRFAFLTADVWTSSRNETGKLGTGNRGQTGSFPFSEVSSRYEPSESCETNIRKRPVCPRFRGSVRISVCSEQREMGHEGRGGGGGQDQGTSSLLKNRSAEEPTLSKAKDEKVGRPRIVSRVDLCSTRRACNQDKSSQKHSSDCPYSTKPRWVKVLFGAKQNCCRADRAYYSTAGGQELDDSEHRRALQGARQRKGRGR